MRAFVLFLISICLISQVFGHLCLFSPKQRGELLVHEPGADSCYRPYAECGNQNGSSVPVAIFAPGETIEIAFQQNFNHWYAANPGYMDAAISFNTNNPQASDFVAIGKPIPDYNANNMVTQTNFTITALLPSQKTGAAVIRVRYVSNNPDEAVSHNPQAIFYQCSDVLIKA